MSKSITFGKKSRVRFSTSAFLSLLAIFASFIFIPTPAQALDTCVSGSLTANANNIAVEPSHGKVLYIDTGVSPRIDGAYIGYRVKNTTGSTISGWWVSLTNFTGGVVNLANSHDQYLQLPDIANNATKTVYFLLKASTSTKISQKHSVNVYNGRPDASTSTSKFNCEFSFTKVAETIKAAANKVTSITVSGNFATGQLVTVVAKGATGTIGAGSPDVGKILWFSPSAFSNFPTSALRLESVTLVTDTNPSVNSGKTYNERLLITPSITPDAGGAADDLSGKRYYENSYKFRVLNKTSTATTIQPIAQISSGTQIKHTNLSDANASTSLSTNTVTTSLTVTKAVTSTSGLSTTSCGSGLTCNIVPYQITLSSSSGTIVVDEVVDTPGTGVTFKTGSAKLGATTISDPVRLSSESSLSPQPYHFIGPFTVTSGSNVLITYEMLVPNTANASFTNKAVAYIGTQLVGASSSTISNTTVTNNSSGGVQSATSSTTTINPVATTFGATSITSSGAVLNGTVDGNSLNPSAQFEWSTNQNLATYTTISLAASVSGSDPVAYTHNFSGTSGATYYYRIVAIKSGTRYEGEIYSFQVIEAASTPTAVTSVATSILSRSATLNGSIDPNLQTITEVRFKYGTDSGLSGATSQILYELDENGNATSTKVTLTGANSIDLSYQIAANSLSLNQTYYFRIEAVYSGGTEIGSILSFKTNSTSQTITFNSLTNQAFAGFSYTVSASTSSGLAITYTSETTDICTVNSSSGVVTAVTTGFCVITASQNGGDVGGTSYAPAVPVTQQFEITPSVPSATTLAATNVGITTATLNGTVDNGGGSTTVTFVYGTASDLTGGVTVTANESPRTTNGAGTYSLTGLTANTTYYFKIAATNSTGSASGTILNFTTQQLIAITIKADDKTITYGQSTPTFTFSLTSGTMSNTDTVTALTYTFTRNSPAYNSTTPPTGAGTYTITISGASISPGNVNDYSITYNTGTYTINKANQATLNLADQTLSQSTTITLLATGGSGSGSVTYAETSETFSSGNCTITSTDQLTTPAANGTCTITATKAADDNYNQTTATGVMTVNSNSPQTITFLTISDRNYSSTPYTHSSITASSTLDVTLTSNTTSVCTVNTPVNSSTAPVITMVIAGTCSITASQSGGTTGGTTYNAAPSVTRTFVINKINQVITFPSINNKTVGDAQENLPTVTDANINITFTTNDTNICTITGSAGSYKVNFVAAGSCTVTANAAGNDIYNDATQVTQTFTISSPTSSGGGSTPVYIPNPPVITSISAAEVCAVGDILTIRGNYLLGATATIDGVLVKVNSSSSNQMILSLPMAVAGVRTLKVTNADGSAATTVKYTFIDTPVYVNYTYPLLYKDLEFSYTFSATDATNYAVQGRLPAGLTIDPQTGEVKGTPTVDGEFFFTIVASNVCGSAYLNVSMFIDNEIPQAFTCSVAFNVPNSNTISDVKLNALRNCFEKILKSAPSTIDPVIFLSGGVPPGLTQEELINHPRYSAICELLNSMGIIAQILVGAFDGPLDQVQVMFYWPEPLDV